MKDKESLDVAVRRELQEETGIDVNYLEQLYSFGAPKRDPRNRVVSVAYFALVRKSLYQIHAATDAAEAKWVNIKELQKLSFDHNTIIEMAVKRLRGKIAYEPIGFELLDEKFPFSDLHQLYELVYNRKIDRRNFRKKFLHLDILQELSEKVSRGKGRPGSLFKFNKEKYFKLKEQEFLFEI